MSSTLRSHDSASKLGLVPTTSSLGAEHPKLTPAIEVKRQDWWKAELDKYLKQREQDIPESDIPKLAVQGIDKATQSDNVFGNLWNKFITSLAKIELEAAPSMAGMATEEVVREWSNQLTSNIDKANFFIQFYDILTVTLSNDDLNVNNFTDIIKVMNIDEDTLKNLTQDDIDEINSAIATELNKIQRGEGELPSWLDIDEEDEKKVREFLTQTPEAPPLSLQRLTISEILKAQSVQPTITPPEGMTMEEVSRVASLMDLSVEDISSVIETDKLVSMIREMTRERENIRDEVLAEIREWTAPDPTFGERLKFMVQSPMQQMANLIQPYLKNVGNPLSGLAALFFGKFISAYNIEETYNDYKAAGYDMWTAAGMAWEENDTAWYWKLPLEILVDPLTYTPGILLKVPGTVFKVAGKSLLTAGAKEATKFSARWLIGAGFELTGSKIIALNKGLLEILDIPWDAIKWFQKNRVAKTWNQIINKTSDDFNLKFHQAMERETGKLFNQWTVDDVEQTLLAAQKEFASGKPTNRTLYELGHMLSEHNPMTSNQIYQWSKSHNGLLADPIINKMDDQLVSEVNQIISDTMMGVGSKEFNATRLAHALMIDVTPENLMKLGKEITTFGAKKAINIQKAIQIGKSTKIGAVETMMNYLIITHKNIVKEIVKGAGSDGSRMGGIILGLQRKVDKIENSKLRLLIDRYWVRPLAQANLGSISYPIWNMLEGLSVNLIEGVIPRFMKEDTYLMLTKGLIGDPAMKLHPGGDISQLFKVDVRHNPGAYSLLPKWMKTITIGLSDYIGSSLRRNFIARKMQMYLAEKALKLADGDVFKALGMIGKNAPKIRKSQLGLTVEYLEEELRRRAMVGVDEMLNMKNFLTDGSLMKAEMHKIVDGKEFLSPRSKALANELIEQGGIFTPGKVSTIVDWGKVKFGTSISSKPQLVEKVKNIIEEMPSNAKIRVERVEIDHSLKLRVDANGNPAPAQADYDFLTGTMKYQSANHITKNITYHEIGHSVIWEKAAAGNYDLMNAFLRASGKQVDMNELNRLVKEGYVNADDVAKLTAKGYTSLQIDNAKYISILKKLAGEDIVDDCAESFSRYMTGKSLRKDVKQMFDEYLPRMEKPTLKEKTSGIDNFIKQIEDIALEDLNLYPYQISDNFVDLANMIDEFPINTSDDLMQVFSNFEVMSETATYIPHRIMRQTMEEAQALRNSHKWAQISPLWEKRRNELLQSMEGINSSLERVRAKISANLDKLTPKQKQAMEAVLERAEASRIMYKQTLENDRSFLNEVWSKPKAQRGSEFWDEAFETRRQMWNNYELESAVPSAGEFVMRKKISQLYHDLPKPKMKPVNAESRGLTTSDVAKVFGVHVDSLVSGMLDNISMHGKPYFVQLVKQSADEYPNLFKGFTEEKIGKLYDEIITQARMNPGRDIPTEKLLNQIQSIKQELNTLRMNHSLSPDEEKALGKWIDDAVEERNKIIGDGGKNLTEIDDLIDYAKSVKNDDIIGIKLVGSKATGGKVPKDTDILYEFKIDLPKDSAKASERVEKLIESSKINLDKYDTFIKVGDRYFHVSSGAGRQVVENTTYAIKQKGKKTIDLLTEKKSGQGLISQDEWNKVRQEALDEANKDYYKSFADYSNETMVSGVMKMIYPYWSYHTYRWFYLTRAAVRHPGLPVTWGKYENYSENGYVPTWMPDIEMNPFVGSILGTTFSLTRNDFSSYYDQLGFVGEMLDYSQRLGFFPGPQFILPIALTPYFSNRKAELSEIEPPIVKSSINLLAGSNIPLVSEAATWLKDKVFHENFQDYMTATLLSNKQVESGGTLLVDENGDTLSGVDIWMKIQRGEKLTEQEQFYWNESYREASLVGLLRSQFPIFRLRTEEYKDAYAKVTQIIEAFTGMSEEQQKELWKNHIQPSDVMGGYSLELKQALDEMWQWKIMLGRGTILMPPDVQDIKIHIDEYYNLVRDYQAERLERQSTIDDNFLQLDTTQAITGSEWRSQYSDNWSTYSDRVEGLKLSDRFKDIEELLSPAGQLEIAERLGFSVPARYPLEEAIDYYFDIELEMKADPVTGEEDYDYTGFWLKREAVRMALTDEQRVEFDNYISKYQTPMEQVFKYAYNTYIRGYMGVNRIILNEFTDDEKTIIKKFYASSTTMLEREQIRNIETKGGTKLISTYERMVSQARENLRLATPKLDFYLYAFGYLGNVTDLKTDAAKALAVAWEADRESILSVIR